jgi:creatinine amidohydrolase
MRLQDLNWMDVENYLTQDNRIILVTGATEQHAYLSLMTDVLIPGSIAEAVARQENVLVAPPLNFGISYLFGDYPGTISLSRQTFDHIILEIVESLFHQGFRRFFILNGNRGNQLPERLHDFQMDGVIRVLWHDWWDGPAARSFAERHGLIIDHANWVENFPFTRVAEVPSEPKPHVNIDLIGERYAVRELLGDGGFGGPYQIDDAQIQELFDAVVNETVLLVQQLATSPASEK